MTFSGSLSLTSEVGEVRSFFGEGKGAQQELELEHLSSIVEVLNDRFGTDLTDVDKLLLDQFEESWVADDELSDQAKNNTLDNFRLVFDRKFLADHRHPGRRQRRDLQEDPRRRRLPRDPRGVLSAEGLRAPANRVVNDGYSKRCPRSTEEQEREQSRIAKANRARSEQRGFVVFATDPEAGPDSPDYRRVYATEERTPARAIRKIRPLVPGRRLRAYLVTGQYRHELANAHWVP